MKMSANDNTTITDSLNLSGIGEKVQDLEPGKVDSSLVAIERIKQEEEKERQSALTP